MATSALPRVLVDASFQSSIYQTRFRQKINVGINGSSINPLARDRQHRSAPMVLTRMIQKYSDGNAVMLEFRSPVYICTKWRCSCSLWLDGGCHGGLFVPVDPVSRRGDRPRLLCYDRTPSWPVIRLDSRFSLVSRCLNATRVDVPTWLMLTISQTVGLLRPLHCLASKRSDDKTICDFPHRIRRTILSTEHCTTKTLYNFQPIQQITYICRYSIQTSRYNNRSNMCRPR